MWGALLGLFPWGRIVAYAVVAGLVLTPYAALRVYVPRYHVAKAQLVETQAKVKADAAYIEVLEGQRDACTASADLMRTARDQADQRRRDAERRLANITPKYDSRIAWLQEKLKEPSDAAQECSQLKSLVDEYTVHSDGTAGLRFAQELAFGGSGARVGAVRQ